MDQGLALLIPALPFVGFIVLGLMKALSKRAVATIATGTVALSFLATVLLFVQHGSDETATVFTYFPWIVAGPLTVDFALQIDRLSLVMCLVVTGVGSLIHYYATAYMWPHTTAHGHDPHAPNYGADGGYSRFFSYLNLFTSLMLVLVLAANFVLMFVGWEGVGLASYLLIGFYYEKWSATQAGKKAFLVNRVGDFCFLIGLMMLITGMFGQITDASGAVTGYTADYQTIFANAARLFASPNYILHAEVVALATAITLLFFLGATGKSAQIPLFVWLPDAMEGPTPVSALIHAATMVTAGVYLLARGSLLFLMSPVTMTIVAVVAVLTALLAATIALTQYDIKRVLAYSTISQLGFMFIGAGLGAFIPAIFHLVTHACFKACLFLGAGSVIHGMEHATGSHDPAVVQDMRHMGGLGKLMPATRWTMLVSTAAIAGIPLTAGFFSKDAILHEGFLMPFVPEPVRIAVVALAYLTAFLTALYMFRLYFMTFEGTYRGIGHMTAPLGHGHHAAQHGEAVESPAAMTLPLKVLAVLAILTGFLLVAPVFTPFEDFLEPVIHPNLELAANVEAGMRGEAALGHGESHGEGGGEESHATALPHATWANSLPFYLISAILSILGYLVAKSIWGTGPAKTARYKQQWAGLYSWASRGWRVDEGYRRLLVTPGMTMFRSLWLGVDEGFIDDTLVEGTGRATLAIAKGVRVLQSGYLRAYALYILLGVLLMLLILQLERGGM